MSANAHRAQRVLALAASSAMALGVASSASAQQYRLQHAQSISLSPAFFGPGPGGVPPASDNGWNPLAVAFDGTNAYVGGFNNGAAAASVGVVKVNSVLSLSPTFTDLVNTRVVANASRGINGLAFGGGSLYSMYDSGAVGDSYIAKYDTAGAEQWKRLDPGGGVARPLAIAYDPGATGGSAQVAFLGLAQGRVASLDPANGNSIKTFSGGASPGGIILGTPVNMGNTWRGIDFDVDGNIALSAESGYQYGLRSAQDVWTTLGAVAGNTSTVLDKNPNGGGVGQGIALLENLVGGTTDLIAVSGRTLTTGDTDFALTFTDSASNVQNADARDVNLRRPDGTTTGLTQLALTGDEDGVGAARFASEIKDVYYGTDPSGLPVMVVSSFVDRRLDVYALEQSWKSDFDGAWDTATNWIGGFVPNSPLHHAVFGPVTTGPRGILVGGAKTVKVLRFDSDHFYMLSGGDSSTITLNSPGTPLIQSLRGNHTITAPIALAKDTRVSVSTGNVLTVRHFRGEGLSVDSGTVRIATNGTDAGRSTVTSLAVAPGATLDIRNNAFVVDYSAPDPSPHNDIRNLIISGYNGGPPNAWTGTGITRSDGNAANFGIGYAEASALTSIPAIFGTVDADAVLFRGTRYGDADLNGSVTLADFNALAGNFGQSGRLWHEGDFNYDGNVNLADFNLLAGNFGLSASSPNGPTAGDWAALAAAVPEPVSAGGIGVALTCLMRRRHRSSP